MRKLRASCQRIRNMFRKNRLERDFDEELESHLELDIDDGIRSGLSPEEARRQALMRLGGIELVKEAHRDRRGIAFIEELVRDLWYWEVIERFAGMTNPEMGAPVSVALPMPVFKYYFPGRPPGARVNQHREKPDRCLTRQQPRSSRRLRANQNVC